MKRTMALIVAAVLCTSTVTTSYAATIEKGDRGGKVRPIQEELYLQGYLDEEADGIFGEGTAAAVRAFQEDNGLEATGIVDDETKALLLNGGISETTKAQELLVKLGYYTGELNGQLNPETAAALGMFQQDNGLDMTQEIDDATRALLAQQDLKTASAHIQQRLIDLGYLDGAADGAFGEQSTAALILFQEANGLESDGMLGPQVREVLFSGNAKGDTPRMIQKRLIHLGYLTGTADGILGKQSISAIKQFQSMHDIEVTGEVDDATWEALFSADAKLLRTTLVEKDRGDAVKALQQQLIVLGFLDDRADGIFGGNTAKAVQAFQEHLAAQGEDLTPSGKATSEVQDIMFSADYSSHISDVALGDESSEALRVERRMYALGYMDANPDSLFDQYAVDCLLAFQKVEGLEETGIADKATMDVLFTAAAQQSERYVLHDIAMGDSGQIVEEFQNGLARMGMMAGQPDGSYGEDTEICLDRLHEYLVRIDSEHAALFEQREGVSAQALQALRDGELQVYVQDVKKGAKASEVTRVQRRLNNLLYLRSSGVDGDYGSGSRRAIEKFQEKNDLPVTGVADEATQKVLFSDAAKGDWSDFKLEVSIADQRVYVYQLNDDGQYELIKTFICSTGLGDTTPRGMFRDTTEPLNRWHYFVKFRCWAQYAWRITGPYYFHSVIFSRKDESTLRTSSLYNLGRKASHGCIRLEVDAAKWIYENCVAGTIVEIY